jgi:hypothetical protein
MEQQLLNRIIRPGRVAMSLNRRGEASNVELEEHMQITGGTQRKASAPPPLPREPLTPGAVEARALVSASGVREAIVDREDLRGVVGFQNDINTLLGLLEEPRSAWSSEWSDSTRPWFPRKEKNA